HQHAPHPAPGTRAGAIRRGRSGLGAGGRSPSGTVHAAVRTAGRTTVSLLERVVLDGARRGRARPGPGLPAVLGARAWSASVTSVRGFRLHRGAGGLPQGGSGIR